MQFPAFTEHPWLPLPFITRLWNGHRAVESERAYSAVAMCRPRPVDEVHAYALTSVDKRMFLDACAPFPEFGA